MSAELQEIAIRYVKRLASKMPTDFSDIFERELFISPTQLEIVNYSRKRPLSAFNPGAVLEGKKIKIFPRIIYDYYGYISSIAEFVIDVNDVFEKKHGKTYKSKIVIYPQKIYERLGTEDPRVLRDELGRYHFLYTGKGYDEKWQRKDVLAYAVIHHRLEKKGFFSLENLDVRSNKDAAFLEIKRNDAPILLRPSIELDSGKLEIGWFGYADLDEMLIRELRPTLPLVPKKEKKVGWSTNAVKVGKNLWAVGYHAVMKGDHSYVNGIAFVNNEGRLEGITPPILIPNKDSIEEAYGDTPWVIFGDGLELYKDNFIWIGGVSDYQIGIFRTEVEKVEEKTKWINKK